VTHQHDMNRVSVTTGRLCREMRPYLTPLAALFVLSLLGTPLALLTPVPLKIAVDNVLNARPMPRALDMLLPAAVKSSDRALLAVAVALVVAVALLNQVREFGTSLLTTYTGERMLRDFRAKHFLHRSNASAMRPLIIRVRIRTGISRRGSKKAPNAPISFQSPPPKPPSKTKGKRTHSPIAAPSSESSAA